MNMTKEEYKRLVEEMTPNSPLGKNLVLAFCVGGSICAIAQGLRMAYPLLGLGEERVNTLVPVTMVFLGALLTALGVYDKIARFAGAGTLVPITGFANAVVSPAMEFRSEGYVLGTGARLFSVAGPVIVYGVGAGVIYGILYWIVLRLF